MVMSLRVSLSQASLLGWVKEVHGGSKRYLCYTKYGEDVGKKHLVLGLTDGVGNWRVKQSEDDLKDLDTGGSDLNKVISDLSKGLQNEKLELTKMKDHIKLTVTCDGRPVDFELPEMVAAVCREELQSLVFSIWDKLETTKRKLSQAESHEKSGIFAYGGAEGQTEKAHGESTMEVLTSSKTKKIKGASLVNPNAKRRKAATGVVFGKDDD